MSQVTFAELEAKILEVIPTAQVEFDNDRQVIVFTNLWVQNGTDELTDEEPEENGG